MSILMTIVALWSLWINVSTSSPHCHKSPIGEKIFAMTCKTSIIDGLTESSILTSLNAKDTVSLTLVCDPNDEPSYGYFRLPPKGPVQVNPNSSFSNLKELRELRIEKCRITYFETSTQLSAERDPSSSRGETLAPTFSNLQHLRKL